MAFLEVNRTLVKGEMGCFGTKACVEGRWVTGQLVALRGVSSPVLSLGRLAEGRKANDLPILGWDPLSCLWELSWGALLNLRHLLTSLRNGSARASVLFVSVPPGPPEFLRARMPEMQADISCMGRVI